VIAPADYAYDTNFALTTTFNSITDVAPGTATKAATQGMRILLFAQTNAVENGVYVVNTDQKLQRVPDLGDGSPIYPGSTIRVINGYIYGNKGFAVSGASGHQTVGRTAITFSLPSGTVINTQRVFGANAGYVPAGNGTNVTSNAAQTQLLSLNFTPRVNCWWQTAMNIGLIQKLDAVWNYIGVFLYISPADADGKTRNIRYQSDHNALPFVSLYGYSNWKLNAGVAYQVYGTFDTPVSTWQYYQGIDHLELTGEAKVR
jgi:hypothetical protein